MEVVLTDKQLQAIPVIIKAESISRACDELNISRTCFYEWLKDPVFKQELKKQRDMVITTALDVLKNAVTKAVDELVKLINSDSERIRHFVCKDIIDYTIKSIELENVEERLTKIEANILNK